MEPLARLPVFFALEGRRAVVAGGTPGRGMEGGIAFGRGRRGRGLCRRALRGDAGARRRAAARRDRHPSPRLGCRRHSPAPPSRSAPATSDDEAARFAAAARAAGVPVNVIDKPKFCDFAFGAIVNRSPLVIGISTDGAAPVFGQAIRAKLEAMIPRGFARWAEAARRWRATVQVVRPVVQRPAAVLAAVHRIRGRAIPTARRQQADYDRLLAETAAEARAVEQGSVTLVGAGPGDPELLTLARGARAAIGRRHPVRRSGVAGRPGFRPARGQEDAGRQDRPRPVLQAGARSTR